MSEKKWLPCPFCGTRLTNKKPSKIYVHERTGCLLDLRGFTEGDQDKWNTRKPMEEVVEKLEEAAWWTESTYDEDGYSNDDGEEVVPLYRAMEIINEVCGT